jgi:hypothetical protein
MRLTCPHETRLLLAMYAGLRLGELSATTHEDLQGRWLTVARQVDETTRRLVPVKTGEGSVGLYIDSLDTTGWTRPDGSPVGDYWTILRGSPTAVVRARYEVPASEGFA